MVGREQTETPGSGGPTFNADFFRKVLPEGAATACEGVADSVPVVNVHLANGRVLDLCHIARIAEAWIAVYYYRNASRSYEMDLAFVPYPLVVLVTVSARQATERKMGFTLSGAPPHRTAIASLGREAQSQ